MNLDDLLFRWYFDTSNVSQVPPAAQTAGIERIEIDLALEKDRGSRFALWALLHLLGSEPQLDVAFEDERDRDAARNFMDLLAATDEE